MLLRLLQAERWQIEVFTHDVKQIRGQRGLGAIFWHCDPLLL